MEWTIRYHREAKKFLRRLEDDKRNLLLNKLNELKICLEEGIFPVRRFDLKKLKGKWIGFFRLRVGVSQNHTENRHPTKNDFRLSYPF